MITIPPYGVPIDDDMKQQDFGLPSMIYGLLLSLASMNKYMTSYFHL